MHRFDGGVDAAERRHQHDRRVRSQLTDLAEQLDPTAAGHPDVGEHDAAIEVREPLQRLGGARRSARLDALVIEQRDDHLAHGGVVVDHENGARFGCHAMIQRHVPCHPQRAPGACSGCPAGEGMRQSSSSSDYLSRPSIRRRPGRWHVLCTRAPPCERYEDWPAALRARHRLVSSLDAPPLDLDAPSTAPPRWSS